MDVLLTKNYARTIAVVQISLCALLCSLTPACSTTAPDTADLQPMQSDRDEVYLQMEKFTEALIHVKRSYIEEKAFEELIGSAIEGMLQSLDPHSHYMGPEAFEALREDTSGEYGGIGVWIEMRDGILTVIAPIEDSPGFKAGIMAQDRIMKIDGKSTEGMTIRNAVRELRGEPRSKVLLTIHREDSVEPTEITVTREEIEVPSVKGARILADGIAYVRLTQFTAQTSDSLVEDLASLKEQGMTALVLDLRSNPGGLLVAARDVAGLFLERGDLVVTTRERGGAKSDRRLFATGRTHYEKLPMVILVNRGSASASEIVAGALQDHRRAVIIGERTFGKGSVQTILKLKDNTSAIRLTTARYHTPGEKVIDKHGIEPDILVPLTLDEWQHIRRQRARADGPGTDNQEDSAVVKDEQLDRAIDVLKALRVFRDQ